MWPPWAAYEGVSPWGWSMKFGLSKPSPFQAVQEGFEALVCLVWEAVGPVQQVRAGRFCRL